MNKSVQIKGERLERTVMELLKKYGDDALEVCAQESKENARQAVSALKGSAPTGGSYARGWSHKTVKARAAIGNIVYNRTDYQLTHLLEKPHATGRNRGGRYPKKVDYTGNIARVEDEYKTKFLEGVIDKL